MGIELSRRKQMPPGRHFKLMSLTKQTENQPELGRAHFVIGMQLREQSEVRPRADRACKHNGRFPSNKRRIIYSL